MHIASFFDRGRRVSKVRPSHRKLMMESLSARCAPSGLIPTTDAPDASEQPAEVSDMQESQNDVNQATAKADPSATDAAFADAGTTDFVSTGLPTDTQPSGFGQPGGAVRTQQLNITYFRATRITQGWLFTGHLQVSEGSPAGAVVTFGGLIAGQTATCSAAGDFNHFAAIPRSWSGDVSAQASLGGATSNTVWVFIY